MEIKKALIPGHRHVENRADLTLTREGNTVEPGTIGIGAAPRALAEILADAGSGPQALLAQVAWKRQCDDAVIELDGEG